MNQGLTSKNMAFEPDTTAFDFVQRDKITVLSNSASERSCWMPRYRSVV
jgi:hypothetical protein